MQLLRKTSHILSLVTVVAVLLFSSIYVAMEADHDCCGEDCPVCAVIMLCEVAVRSIGSAVLPGFAIVAFFSRHLSFAMGIHSQSFSATPVSLKTKLLN